MNSPSEVQVRELAKIIYESEERREGDPAWDDVPGDMGYYCLNEAARRLGWLPSMDPNAASGAV